MRSSYATAVLVGVVAAALAGFAACGASDRSAAANATAGAGGSPLDAMGGGGGFGGGEGGAPSDVPDAGGSGGSLGDGSPDVSSDGALDATDAPPPLWQQPAAFPKQCVSERLTDPTALGPAFSWGPCDLPIAGCQALSLTTAFAVSDPRFIVPQAFEDSSGARISFGVFDGSYQQSRLLVAALDGIVVAAFRGQPAGTRKACVFGAAPLSTSGFAFGGGYFGSPPSLVVVAGTLDPLHDPAVSEPISVQTALIFGAFTNDRVAYTFQTGTLQTRSAKSASDVKTITTEAKQGGELTYPVSAPDRILISTFSGPARVLATDGVSDPYDLVAEPNAGLAGPGFTGTHLVWQRGVGDLGAKGWQTVELWMSPYSSDPSAIVRSKVATLPWNFLSTDLRAGNGWVSIPDWNTGAAVHLWRIPSGEHRVFNAPTGWLIAQIPDLLAKDLLVMIRPTGQENNGHRLLRVGIDSIPIAP
jgi:hypothetical protein